MPVKIYNLCEREDYINFRSNFPDGQGFVFESSFEYFDSDFECFYVVGINNKKECIYRLDGPTLEYKQESSSIKHPPVYVIEGHAVSSNEYWNHPDVKAYAYLKAHPELEAFV